MRYVLSDEQEMFRESLRGWVQQSAPTERVRQWMDAGDHTSFVDRLADEGWADVGLPEFAGGEGGGLVELALAAEEFGRAATPDSAWMATCVVLPVLVGTAFDRSSRPVVLAVDGSRPVEPGAAVSASASDRLSGEVPFVLGANQARTLVVPAGRDDTVALWTVDPTSLGVDVTPRPTIDRSRAVATVRLSDVPATRLEVDAVDVLATARDRMAVLVAAGTIGAADRMLEMSVEYSLQREQFGRPIGSFQAVKHAAAQMLVAIEPVRSVVRYAAWACEVGDPDAPLHAAVAKAQAGPMGEAVAEASLTMHGAIGFTWEHDLQLFYKRVKLDRVLGGARSVWNERIADALDLTAGTTPRRPRAA